MEVILDNPIVMILIFVSAMVFILSVVLFVHVLAKVRCIAAAEHRSVINKKGIAVSVIGALPAIIYVGFRLWSSPVAIGSDDVSVMALFFFLRYLYAVLSALLGLVIILIFMVPPVVDILSLRNRENLFQSISFKGIIRDVFFLILGTAMCFVFKDDFMDVPYALTGHPETLTAQVTQVRSPKRYDYYTIDGQSFKSERVNLLDDRPHSHQIMQKGDNVTVLYLPYSRLIIGYRINSAARIPNKEDHAGSLSDTDTDTYDRTASKSGSHDTEEDGDSEE